MANSSHIKPTPLKKQKSDDDVQVAGGVVVFGALIAFALFQNDHQIIAAFALCAGIALAMAGFNSSEATCPHCRVVVDKIAKSSPTRCDHCRNYVQADDTHLRPLDPDLQADLPTFAAILVEGDRMPVLCFSCGAPAERTERVVGKGTFNAGGNAIYQKIANHTFSLAVPHCSRHQNGAEIAMEESDVTGFANGRPTRSSRKLTECVVKMRSYRTYRAYLHLNDRATPYLDL